MPPEYVPSRRTLLRWRLDDWRRRCVEHWRYRFVWALPRWLVTWCVVRCFVHGASGPYGDTEPDSLRYGELMRRWEHRYGPPPARPE